MLLTERHDVMLTGLCMKSAISCVRCHSLSNAYVDSPWSPKASQSHISGAV